MQETFWGYSNLDVYKRQALFGDLARRMALANPGKDVNPLEGSGVVLIDELDLHMHTSVSYTHLDVYKRQTLKQGGI